MKQVFFVTSLLAQQRGFDRETRYLVDALKKRNIKSVLVAWNDPNVKWEGSLLSIIRTPHDYFLNVQEFLKWTRQVEKETTLWNQSQVIEWNSHKKYLKQLQDDNVPVPPTILAEHQTATSLEDIIRGNDWNEIIIKPAISIGAWGARRFNRDSPEAQEHLDNVLLHGYEHVNARNGKLWKLESGDAIIQKFIPEIMSQGEASLVYFGGDFSHAVKKMPKAGEFRVHDVYGGDVLPYEASNNEREVAEMGLDSLGLQTQYARIDTVLSADGPLIIEMELIEPRLFFEYFPYTVESYADYIRDYLKN